MSNNRAVAHSFAYGNNDKGSNFYSESYGNLLYSYGSLLARKFENGIILISEPISRYSNSSQKHHSHLIHAINHREYYYVNDLSGYGKLEEFFNDKELDRTCKDILDLYIKQSRARKTDYSFQIKKELDKCEAIIKYGKIDKRQKPYKKYVDIRKGIKSINQLVEDGIKAEKNRKTLEAKRKFTANKKRYTNFTGIEWDGTATELANYNHLIISGEEILTDSHARVGLNEAKVLYKAWSKGKDIVGQKIGYYTVLKANKKEVKIGCHLLLGKELHKVLGA